jgi:hypothetical protein
MKTTNFGIPSEPELRADFSLNPLMAAGSGRRGSSGAATLGSFGALSDPKPSTAAPGLLWGDPSRPWSAFDESAAHDEFSAARLEFLQSQEQVTS